MALKRSLSIEIIGEVLPVSKKINNDSDIFILNDGNHERLDPKDGQNENFDEVHIDEIASIINDCDLDFIREKVVNCTQSLENRVRTVINQILDAESYPKQKETLLKRKKQESIHECLNKDYDLDDLCKTHPDLEAYFNDQTKNRSETYKNNTSVFLANRFLNLATESIESALRQFNYALVPTYHLLDKMFSCREKSLKKRCALKEFIYFRYDYKKYKYLNKLNDLKSYTGHFDEDFCKELWFIRNETTVMEIIKRKKLEKYGKLAKARLDNRLIECPCCYDNENLIEDMLSCENGHFFCRNCIKKYVEVNIGQMKYIFRCFGGDGCGANFSNDTLKKVLEKDKYEKLCHKMGIQEIQSAVMENLESCAFCDYAAIIDNPNEKIFYCFNPECMKETCRKCHQVNHLPLSCEEADNSEVDMRTWIENRMNEAMIRVCYKCNKRFYKEEGCNMIHCECGAKMCYLCKQPIISYSHFSARNSCSQFNDTNQVHMNEMKEAYEKACQEYYEKYPNKADLKLKFDPKVFLEQFEKDMKKSTSQIILLNNQPF